MRLICLAWCLICLALFGLVFGLVFALFLALFGFVVFGFVVFALPGLLCFCAMILCWLCLLTVNCVCLCSSYSIIFKRTTSMTIVPASETPQRSDGVVDRSSWPCQPVCAPGVRIPDFASQYWNECAFVAHRLLFTASFRATLSFVCALLDVVCASAVRARKRQPTTPPVKLFRPSRFFLLFSFALCFWLVFAAQSLIFKS